MIINGTIFGQYDLDALYVKKRRKIQAQIVGGGEKGICAYPMHRQYKKTRQYKNHRNMNKSGDVKNMISLLADISLIATTRQAQRMTMLLVMFKYVYDNLLDECSKNLILQKFNVLGNGAFYTYKKACETKWEMNGSITFHDMKAAQAAFHGIFGTFKEDLGILESITNTPRWLSREEFGSSFWKIWTGRRNSNCLNLQCIRSFQVLTSQAS